MSQKQEVEIRAKVDSKHENSIVNKLKELGATFIKTTYISDLYFCANKVKTFSEIEMDEVGSYSLRLRELRKDNAEAIFSINTKVITSYGDHRAWDEFESGIDSLEQMKLILKSLGFKEFFKIVKSRDSYGLGEIQLEVENIEDFGMVLEAEIMAEASESEVAKKKILDLFSELSIQNEEIFPKSATNYLMRLRAKF